MAFTPSAGSTGRIRYGSNTTATGIKSWRITQASPALEVTNFESAVDSNSVIGEEWISSNIAGWKARIEAIFDFDTTNSDAVWGIGTSLSVDYIYLKATSLGFHNKTSIVTMMEKGPILKEGQAYTLEVQGSAPLGVPATS